MAHESGDDSSTPLNGLNESKCAEYYMALALDEARKGEGKTHPNPCVGAVIVRDGQIVGRGFHARAGGPHAEIVALRDAAGQARGADIYVTLEPCDHTGRTPPCTKALIEAGIARVFVGCTDINPKVSGRGIERLRNAGIEVTVGILQTECEQLNAPFFKFISTGRPFVTLKAASTLDGKIADASGHSKWVTGTESRRKVHEFRQRADAILVGAGTLRADNPELTARPDGIPNASQPLRVVVSADLARLPLDARLFATATPAAPVLVVTSDTSPAASAVEAQLKSRSPAIVIEYVPAASNDCADLGSLLDALGRRGILHLFVEGGGHLFSSFLAERLFDRLQLFLAPKILGSGLSWASADLMPPAAMPASMEDALCLSRTSITVCGEDILLTLEPQKHC